MKDNLWEDPLSQAVFAAVIRDERAHLAFHASYLSWAAPQLNWRQKKVMWFKNSLSYFLMAGPIYFFLAKGYRPLVGDTWWEWFKMCRAARHKAYQRELRFLR